MPKNGERKRPRFLAADFEGRLKAELKRRGWGPAELGKRLTPTVTRQTVHQWLNGKDEPETFRWANINATLGVDLCPLPNAAPTSNEAAPERPSRNAVESELLRGVIEDVGYLKREVADLRAQLEQRTQRVQRKQ